MSQKRANQRDRILALLIAAGPTGVTNLLLNEVAFRYGGRLHELRKQGWDIETKAEGESVFRFILHGRRQPEQLRLIA